MNGKASAAPSIQASHLSRRFGSFLAVDDVSFEVEKGEIFGYLGANGAGKSTTIRMLIGLLVPTAGEGRVAGFGAPVGGARLVANERRVVVHRVETQFDGHEVITVRSGWETGPGISFRGALRRAAILSSSPPRPGANNCSAPRVASR